MHVTSPATGSGKAAPGAPNHDRRRSAATLAREFSAQKKAGGLERKRGCDGRESSRAEEHRARGRRRPASAPRPRQQCQDPGGKCQDQHHATTAVSSDHVEMPWKRPCRRSIIDPAAASAHRGRRPVRRSRPWTAEWGHVPCVGPTMGCPSPRCLATYTISTIEAGHARLRCLLAHHQTTLEPDWTPPSIALHARPPHRSARVEGVGVEGPVTCTMRPWRIRRTMHTLLPATARQSIGNRLGRGDRTEEPVGCDSIHTLALTMT